jgi:hypothetical protein
VAHLVEVGKEGLLTLRCSCVRSASWSSAIGPFEQGCPIPNNEGSHCALSTRSPNYEIQAYVFSQYIEINICPEIMRHMKHEARSAMLKNWQLNVFLDCIHFASIIRRFP